ncbi:hypothetical protein PDK26_23590 [Bacillus cereus]|nr:hypothetical protein [Bacillus cereus]
MKKVIEKIITLKEEIKEDINDEITFNLNKTDKIVVLFVAISMIFVILDVINVINFYSDIVKDLLIASFIYLLVRKSHIFKSKH